MIDIYAERHGPGLFEEPINTITNLAFIIAAFFAWKLARRCNVLSLSVWLMIALAAMIGIGSALWHMFAEQWALLMDVVPILLFQVWFLWLYLRGNVGFSGWISATLVLLYAGICLSMTYVPPYLNGSIRYFPSLILLMPLGVFHYRSNQPGRWLLFMAALLFIMALLFRTIDQHIESHIHFGTHFLWHLFNGGLVYVVMKAIILKQSQRAET